MEIHPHHSHNEIRHGWKHYLFDFLMLFLAVTLGFLTENLREGINNKTDLRKSMQSLVADLQTDVTTIDSVVAINTSTMLQIDSLIHLLNDKSNNTSRIYYLARITTLNNGAFVPTTNTFDLLKSSGSLKLIEPASLLDSISSYYIGTAVIQTQSQYLQQDWEDLKNANVKVYNGMVLYQLFQSGKVTNPQLGSYILEKPENNPPLFSNNPADINAAIVNDQYVYASVKIYNDLVSQIRKQANSLMVLIQKQYHLQ